MGFRVCSDWSLYVGRKSLDIRAYIYIYIYIYIFFVFFSKKGLRVQGLGLKACTLELETYICVRMDSIKP